jgi:group I intron endonuclease
MNKKKKYKFYFIYQITNEITNKSYIGWHATNNMDDNYLGSGKYLKNSIKKYGKDNFSKTILEHCNEDNVLEKEIFWISKNNTFSPNGYNLTLGGEGSLGREATPETREKLRLAQLGKKAGEETKRKMIKTRTGKKVPNYKPHPISEETKLKISKAKKGIPLSPEACANMNKSKRGIPLSQEHKEKLRKSQLGSSHNLKTVTCPHCGLSGKGGNMTRYHFSNCKNL